MHKRVEAPVVRKLPCPDFTVGEWVVTPSRNAIRRLDRESEDILEPLLVRFLCALADRAGGTATRDELIEEVWNGIVVSDEAVAQAASRLRRALGDDPRSPSYIETVRKLGYRLIARVGPPPEAARPRRVLPYAAAAGAALLVLAGALYLRSAERPFRLEPAAVDARDERRASISPDGRQFVFELAGADGVPAIWIGGGEGGDSAPLAGTEGAEAPVWLSNRMLAMQLRRADDCTIVSYDLGSRRKRALARCDGSRYPDLAASPDGRRLAFGALGAQGSGPSAIHVAEPGGRARRLTAPPPESWGDYDPEFSPDGETLLFTRAVSEGQQDLYLVDSAGRERRLTRRFGNIYGAAWLSSGEIAYSARSGNRYGLRRLVVATGRDEALQLPAFDIVHPVVRDGVFLVESRRFETRLVAAGPAARQAWPNSSGINLHPALSPDGRRSAFVSDRSGSLELWLVESGGPPRRLTRHGGPFVGGPRFSPDGRRLVYEVRDGDDSDVHVIDLATGTSRPLLRGRHFDTIPSFSADGRRLYFASDRGSGWGVHVLDLEGDGTPALVLAGAFAALDAPDGSAFYFTRRDRPGLFRRDGRTGRISIVEPRFAAEDWGGFAPVRGGVVFVERTAPGRARIVLASVDGTRRTLATPSERVPSHDPVLAVSPGLDLLVYAQTAAGSGDLYRVHR